MWVADADGSNAVPLVQDDRINVFPKWTPDGEHLVYISETPDLLSSNWEFRRIAISGGVPETIFQNAADEVFDVGPLGQLIFQRPDAAIQSFDPSNGQSRTILTLPGNTRRGIPRQSPDGKSVAYIVPPGGESDRDAGLWVDDLGSAPRQVFRGWVNWYARGPGNEIYLNEGTANLDGVLWKVGWNGEDLRRMSAGMPLNYNYWIEVVGGSQNFFDVSPDGRYLISSSQDVLQANIGMIEDRRRQ